MLKRTSERSEARKTSKCVKCDEVVILEPIRFVGLRVLDIDGLQHVCSPTMRKEFLHKQRQQQQREQAALEAGQLELPW